MRTLSIFIIGYLLQYNFTYCQDSLSIDILKPLSYSFTIENGKLEGSGAQFLADKLSKAQYTMLGEYHGSKNISEFTEGIIPLLNTYGYHHLVLEVGPNTGAYLDAMPPNKKSVISELKSLNSKYLRTEGKYDDTPIPFFDKVEDAKFLGAAKERDWKIIGIDQEFIDGFMWQIDCMFDNLNVSDQKLHSNQHKSVQSSINKMFLDYKTNNISYISALKKSNQVQDYLDLMKNEPKNVSLVEAFRKSVEIYYMNHIGKWYENNGTRIKYMKESLRLGLEADAFDISKDKLLIKMGAYHIAKGFTPLNFYEVGSTLNELAEYHGNEAVGIGFMNRFEMTETGLEDALELNDRYYDSLRNFYGMGSKDEWVIIDLQPLRKGYYYHTQKYLLSTYEQQFVKRFDMIIITPTESEGRKNY